MSETVFREAYNRLNSEQKDAVDTIEGPVMVIAGPGTGKTQILTLRIANILKNTDTKPENILALTFTESGARAMRERLASYIGASAYRVHIHTFHEFAGQLIREFPDAYERAVGGKPISDLEKIILITSILETPEIKLLRPHGNPEFYIKPILSALSTMKREYITPERFVAIIGDQERVLAETPKLHEKGAHKGKVRSEYVDREKRMLKNRELLFVYRAYEATLKEKRYFDFDDMIFETVEALVQNENMLRSLQERYQYILADEHQDVNGSQNKILELLASFHERPNIFVVGDEKQSIYRFQGASLENFLYFEEKFPHTKTIALTENYRSTQNILDLSHELIFVEDSPAKALRVPLTAHTKKKGHIERRSFSHEAVEHTYLIEHIKKCINEKIPLEEIAIILRTNREVEEIASLLRKHGIRVEASADTDILSHPITVHVRMLITATIEPSNERMLYELMQSSYVGLSLSDIVLIMKHRSYERTLTKILTNKEVLKEIGVQDIEHILKFMNTLTAARERMLVDAPHRVLEYLMKESGFLDYTIMVDPQEGARIIRRLYDEVEEMVRTKEAQTLRDIAIMFETRTAHELPLKAPYIKTDARAVQVMTAHKAKGLEFLHVFIPHLTDQKWGGKGRMEYFSIPTTTHLDASLFNTEDDEKKLLYVALTRAKEGLYLSSARANTEGRPLLPTRLLEEIGESVIQDTSGTLYEEAFDSITSLGIVSKALPIDIALLTEVLRERGLSATALNNYLRDPWSYFFRNVLRIPEVQAESAQFGTALHDTLRSVMKHRREQGTLPSTTMLKTYLERELGKLPLTQTEFVRLHERALIALTSYLAHVENVLPHETKEEYKIQVILKTGIPELPELLLTGMLDRLDFDAEGGLIRVVDYKSGKAKTRGYIEGKTKDSHGDYKRQLTFYALLLSLQDNEQLRTREGLLSFIEPDEKGMIHEEAYTIMEEEIETLKEKIVSVVREIIHGTFLEVPCDVSQSDYCELATELQHRL